MGQRIWLPQLQRVYKTTFDGQEVYVRFSAYGVSHSSSDKPIDLTFGVYEDEKCKKSVGDDSLDFWHKRKEIYDCEFEDTGIIIERLNEKKLPETLEKLLHILSLKSNKTARMSIAIQFKSNVDTSLVPKYCWRATINKLEDGTYEYGYFERYAEAYVKSFTANDVVEMSGKVLGKRFDYKDGQILWK